MKISGIDDVKSVMEDASKDNTNLSGKLAYLIGAVGECTNQDRYSEDILGKANACLPMLVDIQTGKNKSYRDLSDEAKNKLHRNVLECVRIFDSNSNKSKA